MTQEKTVIEIEEKTEIKTTRTVVTTKEPETSQKHDKSEVSGGDTVPKQKTKYSSSSKQTTTLIDDGDMFVPGKSDNTENTESKSDEPKSKKKFFAEGFFELEVEEQ